MGNLNITMNRNCSPCKGCTRTWKRPACHDSCPDYAEWKAVGDAARKNRVEYIMKPFSPIK